MKSSKHRKNIDHVRRLRVRRVRAKIHGTAECPRLSVHRSLLHLSAQLIDDNAGRTLLSVSDRLIDKKLKGVAAATALGEELAKLATAKAITKVYFDRRSYRYHGKVKALAEAARAGGLSF